AAFTAGICSAGGDAVLLGVFTTPGVAHLTMELEAQVGVVISASHNPAEYNGIKFFAGTGYTLPDQVEDEIELESLAGQDRGRQPVGRQIGRVRSVADARERYLRHLEGAAEVRLDGLRVVVDCANGSASEVARELLG